ncbi:type II toxin-antitoxin system death-on-curing family toxin [Lentibacillus sp. Marseille-P4043]|uniref:type II toxin-antitoxin system death-on-curing family toxin n=1 Tax=Lentibacillus sp. Marseille-P4043 TaxID=2040293 RepID=UPI000D0B9B8F|nr:type II toxin-antitoxin system death-on-curing family toxin [Lentibacillus sp. Marseille-P4043]
MNYLLAKDVTLIHFIVMKKYGEEGQAGIKDERLLESAVHLPQQSVLGEDAYPSLFDKAGVLFESLAGNHCFVDGNAKTAVAVLDIFLKKNGFKLKQNDQEMKEFTTLVAEGQVPLPYIANWLVENTEKGM